ncbi:TonB-dependent receptor [Methylibium sp.]|uniref:TonB-dependent siderophore receptor n=1 Tax=Methylibium sp. TaxID=2067992 RepID=UPI003341840E
MRPARFTPAPLALAAAITAALAPGFAPTARAQSGTVAATPVAIDLAAQPLGQALNELARQANLQVSFPAALVAGKTAPAVSGRLTVQQAMDRLLAGSGLTADMQGSSVVVKPASPAEAVGETTLPAIKVTAQTGASPLGYLAKDTAAGALGNKALLDTPFSITVVDSNEITERGAKSIGQIFVNDASVYTPTASSTTDWWGTQIRGMPVRNSYIDDIPMLLYWGGDFPTEIVESVSALKGLTGFMYGFGEPGGALSYQLKRPKKADETTVSLGYRNSSLFSAHVDTSRNLADDLAIRANLATEQGTAYNESEIDRTVASLAVDKKFGASLNWFTTLAYEDNENRGEPMQFYFSRYDASGSGGRLPSVTHDYDDINVDNSYYKTETLLASTGLQWQINDQWNLKYQVGLTRKEHRSNKTFAYLLNQAGDYQGYAYNFAGKLDNLFTQAILQGNVTTGALKHEIVGGLGLQRSKEKWSPDFYWSNDFNGNIHQEQTFRITRVPDFSLGPVSLDARQTYAFVSDTVHFNERWQAIVGLRFTDYRLKDLDGDPANDSSYEARETSPTLALIYKLDARTRLYGSYIEGLEPGTRITPPYANAGEVLGATVSKQYEVGVKHESGDIDYAAALFRVERSNQMDVPRGTDLYLTQDGLLVYQGIELSGAYQLTKDLNLGLGAIYLDATIDKVSPESAALEGNKPAYAPRWQVVGNAQYRVPGIAGLKLHGNVRYFGASYTGDDNTLKIPDRTVANAGLSYDFRMQNHDLTLLLNVYNLFNTRYWAGGGWSSGNIGESRNISLGLTAQF